MFGNSTTSLALASWSRSIRHGHGAGLSLVRVFEIQVRSGPLALRPVAARVVDRLKAGDSLDDALRAESRIFPEMFISMATVADQSGRIPEVFGHLEEYYRLQHELNRKFRSSAIWPILQFIAAVVIIALTIMLMSILGDRSGGGGGESLSGPIGAMVFLLVVGAMLFGSYCAYRAWTGDLDRRAAFEARLLGVPWAGPMVRAMAMSRFCLALRLTLDSSMSMPKAVHLSLRATGNEAFIRQSESIVKRIRKGDEFSEAVTAGTFFPVDFVAAVAVGEAGGQIPEAMARQADHYREETEVRMRAMTRAMGWAMSGMVALALIVAIFRVASVYTNALNG